MELSPDVELIDYIRHPAAAMGAAPDAEAQDAAGLNNRKR